MLHNVGVITQINYWYTILQILKWDTFEKVSWGLKVLTNNYLYGIIFKLLVEDHFRPNFSKID